MSKLICILFFTTLSFSTFAADVTKPAKPSEPSAPAAIVKPEAGVIVPNNNRGNRPQEPDDWVNPNDRVDKRMYPEDRTEEQATEEMNRRLLKDLDSKK